MNRNHIMTMLDLQATMNAKINPSWAVAGYPFLRAVIVEGGEAMEHFGWKWWKKQQPDIGQFKIELVDIWHFMLSHALVEWHGEKDLAADMIDNQLRSDYLRHGISFDGRHFKLSAMITVSKLELLIGLSAARRISVPLFESIMKDVGMTWDELYVGYVGKNVLNTFRQDHGYKEGTYVKFWPRAGGMDNVEDNVVLEEIMQVVKDPETIYWELKTEYSKFAPT